MILSTPTLNKINTLFASLVKLMKADLCFFIIYNYSNKDLTIINNNAVEDLEIIKPHEKYFHDETTGVLLWYADEQLKSLNNIFGSTDGMSAIFRTETHCYIFSLATTNNKYKFYNQVINNMTLLKLVTTNIHKKLVKLP